MKTSRCVSIQIFPFQLLLFWWAYCSLFPWHPAAILQLLIFTSVEERKKKKAALSSGFLSVFSAQRIWRQTQTPRQRNSRYVSSHLRSKITFASANELAPRLQRDIPKQELGSTLCLVPSSSLELKMKASAAAQWCLTDWYEAPKIVVGTHGTQLM